MAQAKVRHDTDNGSKALNPAKFRDPAVTIQGQPRARVALARLETLWINTGSLCNIECDGCYIESSPKNDRLAYITRQEVAAYLDEIEGKGLPVGEIGFTGGEPFMNRDLPGMLEDALSRGFRVLVLTNAMAPLWQRRDELSAIRERHGNALALRVSIDHYQPERHELIRGRDTWAPMVRGLEWLAAEGFSITVAARLTWDETEADIRAGFAGLFEGRGLSLDAGSAADLVLFPDMDATRDVPEISEACWNVLGVDPADMMCATSRMVVKRRGAAAPVVLPCTLLPYDRQFEMGETLADALNPVTLNHPHCATFCVLGGASCSGGG